MTYNQTRRVSGLAGVDEARETTDVPSNSMVASVLILSSLASGEFGGRSDGVYAYGVWSMTEGRGSGVKNRL